MWEVEPGAGPTTSPQNLPATDSMVQVPSSQQRVDESEQTLFTLPAELENGPRPADSSVAETGSNRASPRHRAERRARQHEADIGQRSNNTGEDVRRRRPRRATRSGTEQGVDFQRAWEDDDRSWGTDTDNRDERLLQERPPHWA